MKTEYRYFEGKKRSPHVIFKKVIGTYGIILTVDSNYLSRVRRLE